VTAVIQAPPPALTTPVPYEAWRASAR